jgi:hypothetical protein
MTAPAWKLVPTTPTTEMIDAVIERIDDDEGVHIFIRNLYEDMLAVAPEPPQAEGWRGPANAVEFGEYLARAAVNYMNAVNDGVEAADRAETWNALNSAIHEFRKRAFAPSPPVQGSGT